MRLQRLFIIALFCLVSLSLSAQSNSKNPFELADRYQSALSESPLENPNNPFEIQRPKKEHARTNIPNIARSISMEESMPKERDVFEFVLILPLFIFFVFLGTLFLKPIRVRFQSFTNQNLLNQLVRRQESASIFDLLAYCFFMFAISIFTYLAGKHLELLPDIKRGYLIGILFLAFAGTLIAKHLVVYLLGLLFREEKAAQGYGFIMMVFYQIAGLICLPFILLLAFGPDQIKLISLYGFVGILAAILLFRVVRSLFLGQKFLLQTPFHFFLYLCTIEIAPILAMVLVLIR